MEGIQIAKRKSHLPLPFDVDCQNNVHMAKIEYFGPKLETENLRNTKDFGKLCLFLISIYLFSTER